MSSFSLIFLMQFMNILECVHCLFLFHTVMVMASSSKVWEGIMQAETTRTFKGLAWNAYREALPVKSLLSEKGVIGDAICLCWGH